jgi:Arc/MetJ-type ribon-helix-helix transcriptional regulator
MSTAFPPDIAQFVAQELAAGHYQSEDDLLVDAVRRLRDGDEHLRKFKAQLRDRMERIERGDAVKVQRDEMRGFLDGIMASVNSELSAEKAQAR